MKNNLFLFIGEETYLLNAQVNEWKQAFREKHGDMNLDMLDADEKPLNEIMAAATAVPFLADKRLIFIYNLPDPVKTRNPDVETKKDEKRDEDLKKLEKSLTGIPDSSVVVFVQPNPDRRRSFYKKLSAMAEVREFSTPQGKSLINWIQKETELKKSSIDPDTAEYLISLTGQNLWRLSQEISKMTSHSPGQPMTKHLIDQVVTPTLEANIFSLTDALGAKDHRKAIQDLHRTMAAGEHLRPVFYMVVRQFRLLLQASSYMSNNPNGNYASFASSLKIHPFVARNTLAQLKHFRPAELKDAYGRLLEIDFGMKTSRIRITTEDQDELALAIERFILKFCCK
jgi:DNA polymerase-3 subunit delta